MPFERFLQLNLHGFIREKEQLHQGVFLAVGIIGQDGLKLFDGGIGKGRVDVMGNVVA